MESDIIDIVYIKRTLIILSLFALLFSVNVIVGTYGKYLTTVNETTDIKIAKWSILVNNEDVRNGTTQSNVITPVFLGNSNINEDVIAPTAEGYFDLVIDGTNADVSFRYDIDISVSETSSVSDLVVTGYSINGGETLDYTDTISNIVPFQSENKINIIRVYIKWDDGENSTMTNEEDTETTTLNVDAKMDVSLTFTQIAS